MNRKLVRILFNDGSTYSGVWDTIQVDSELITLTHNSGGESHKQNFTEVALVSFISTEAVRRIFVERI